jgi:hypothetical protein
MINRLLLGIMFFLSACNAKTDDHTPIAQNTTHPIFVSDTATNFFPVTAFLQGEIYGIRNGGITPIKKTTIAGKTDSLWIHEKEFDTVFTEFLSPIIDTANLKNIYSEKKFLDQTLNAFTFTYDLINGREDTFAFKHWDVYVDPESNKVTRVYLTKVVDAQTELKLFWESGKWCKIVTVKTLKGNATVSKEEKISWSYD